MIITEKDYNSLELQEYYENHPRWIITIKNEKDEEFFARPNKHPAECWKELRRFLVDNKNYEVIGMMVGFRDNLIALPAQAEGYYFRCSILATYNWEKHSFIIGALENGILTVAKYELPEVIYLGSEQRNPLEAEESLIWRKNNQPCI